MTAVQKCITWFVAAATSLIVGGMLGTMQEMGETSDGFGAIGLVLVFASVPCAVCGVFWLVRAATNPGS